MPVKVNLPDGRVVHFPDGMSPTDIESAVRGISNGGDAPSTPQPLIGHALTASDETPTFKDRLVNGFVDNPLIQGAAHPQSLGDFASLLLPQTPTAVARTVGRAMQPVVAPVARGAATVIENVPYARKVIPFADAVAGRLRTVAQASQDAGMGVTRGADMYEMPRFQRSTESTARVPMMHGEPSTITDAMRAQMAMDAERAPGGVLERLVRKEDVVPRPSLRERLQNGPPIPAPEAAPIQPMASHGQTGAIRTTSQPSMMESAELRAKQILPDVPPASGRVPTGHGSQPDNLLDLPEPGDVGRANGVSPEQAQTTPPDMAAQEARFNRGSQRLGREQGMSRADAQAQTDSVQGTRADTSLVAPWEAQQRMMAKMEAMRKADPTGRTIVEYIDKAADPKTKAALINWERQAAFSAGRAPFYALAGASVAPSIRDMLLDRMRAGVTGRDSQ